MSSMRRCDICGREEPYCYKSMKSWWELVTSGYTYHALFKSPNFNEIPSGDWSELEFCGDCFARMIKYLKKEAMK